MPDLPYRPCVGIVLVNTNGKIFTAERFDRPGAWQMPQGGVDEGEGLKEAAFRELEEETSVPASAVELITQTKNWVFYDLPPELVGKALEGKYRGQKQYWFLMKLMGDESLINLDTKHPEFSRWKWSTKEELVSEIVDFKRDVYEQVAGELLD